MKSKIQHVIKIVIICSLLTIGVIHLLPEIKAEYNNEETLTISNLEIPKVLTNCKYGCILNSNLIHLTKALIRNSRLYLDLQRDPGRCKGL